KLTDEERVYLNAAALGDVPILRQSLEDIDVPLNLNCVDYMGRSALHLAVDNDNMESIELLLDRLQFECLEESLLHAIIRTIIEHPSYIAGEESLKKRHKDPFFRTDEKSQFSPDITPLILAAHYNNHEIIQMFLSRNHTIVKPHHISCRCSECVTKRGYDSLKRSRSRLNAYRALASPAYMALSSPDPIMTTFELRQEMKKLAQVEKEFKSEYLSLVEQCMDFACELMDLCRGTQEVEAVLSEGSQENGSRDPLARLKMAMQYEEKKFVAHPNCQQHLTSIWYGPETGFMQSLTLWKKSLMWVVCVPLVPVFCFVYILSPDNKIGNAMRCPASKFITHTLSHVCFLILLAAATFRLDEKFLPIPSTRSSTSDWFENRSLGLLWMECKQMHTSGLRIYLLDDYNIIDFIVLSLYLASYTLRFLVDHRIKSVDKWYNQARFYWKPNDPEIVSDVLFAVANVVSIARTTYLMPAFEVLGPLQISLGRMIGDITRFLVLFTLVLLAFMVGIHNLYWYYGSQTFLVNKDGEQKLMHTSEAFQGMPRTLLSLFWSMFGLVSVDSVEIKHPSKEKVGHFLFALYHVAIIIVLTNMLIAMMSHSFEAIQGDCDVEWKFARTRLWVNYIDEGNTLPVPFNMIPTPKSLAYIWQWVKELFKSQRE
ncbi:hypothetical protein HELRODRAFT_130200, partial [Helobdella robusta]|uniref:Transient receptor ion channel domain-containing protein n=1 Tax=Helobdella robusta TaxID=6412 RepID=T1EHT3_HELRO